MDYSQESPVLFPSSYLHWGGKVFSLYCPDGFPSLTFHLSLTSIPRTFIFSPSRLCVSLSLSLARYIWQIQSIHTHFQALKWLHGLATQLGAHYLLIHRLEDRQRQSAFLLCSLLPSFYISFSPGTFSSHFSHLTLCYNTSSPWCIMSLCVLRRINSSISIA